MASSAQYGPNTKPTIITLGILLLHYQQLEKKRGNLHHKNLLRNLGVSTFDHQQRILTRLKLYKLYIRVHFIYRNSHRLYTLSTIPPPDRMASFKRSKVGGTPHSRGKATVKFSFSRSPLVCFSNTTIWEDWTQCRKWKFCWRGYGNPVMSVPPLLVLPQCPAPQHLTFPRIYKIPRHRSSGPYPVSVTIKLSIAELKLEDL